MRTHQMIFCVGHSRLVSSANAPTLKSKEVPVHNLITFIGWFGVWQVLDDICPMVVGGLSFWRRHRHLCHQPKFRPTTDYKSPAFRQCLIKRLQVCFLIDCARSFTTPLRPSSSQLISCIRRGSTYTALLYAFANAMNPLTYPKQPFMV